ncbi:MAG: hypothetical protein V7L21_33345, partial [Nostoc sp.]|uniref:hypothetical protein n=1 Tax=Nostoc sp. TaxID=1180 RepID=UPI002FFD322B
NLFGSVLKHYPNGISRLLQFDWDLIFLQVPNHIGHGTKKLRVLSKEYYSAFLRCIGKKPSLSSPPYVLFSTLKAKVE